MTKTITVITGPTASGKTALAIELAKKIDAEIICADSRIIYKDLDIVSAKPEIQEQQNIVHHLIDIKTPNEDFSAGDFVKLATSIINNTEKNIIIAGGTWFYIKSLLDKKALIDCPTNLELRNDLQKLTKDQLWEKLNSLDPKRAHLIHPNNKDKVIRSIELCLYLKSPLSEYERKDNTKLTAVWYMPNYDRQTLYERINTRVDDMIKKGLYEEWEENKLKYPNSKILENTIGYSEFFDLEKGIYKNHKEAVEKIKQHTRNFAKRQLTYFKSNENIKLINNLNDILQN